MCWLLVPVFLVIVENADVAVHHGEEGEGYGGDDSVPQVVSHNVVPALPQLGVFMPDDGGVGVWGVDRLGEKSRQFSLKNNCAGILYSGRMLKSLRDLSGGIRVASICPFQQFFRWTADWILSIEFLKKKLLRIFLLYGT